jgi:hypothetical protein
LQLLFFTCFVTRSVELELIDLENLHVAGEGTKSPTWTNPHVKKTSHVFSCPHFGADCSPSPYGRVFYTYPADYDRLHTRIPRNSDLLHLENPLIPVYSSTVKGWLRDRYANAF